MKKVFCALLLFSSLCNAQDYYIPHAMHRPGQNHKWSDTTSKITYFFSFDLGVSIPMRDYGSTDTTHNFMIYGPDSTHGKGFAKTGFYGSISGGAFITPNFGVCAKIAYNENTFDESMINLLVNGQYNYTINDHFVVWQFMGGAFADIRIGKRASVWVQGMAGLIHANFPSFSIYNAYFFPPYISWNFSLPNANDLAYSASLSYEQPISANVSVMLTASYTGAELVYPTLTYNLSGPYYNLPPPYTQHTPVTMSFGSMNLSAGLLFHF